MKFYTVNSDYIAYLKKHDSKVPDNYGGCRPYVGIVLEINEHDYLAPLTSYKPKQDRLDHSNPTIFKINEKHKPNNKLGMLHLNNMIPVLDSVISEVIFAEQEEHYKNLLTKQYEYIKSEQDAIKRKANHLYTLVTIKKNNHFCNLSCSFVALEAVYKSF